jgi:hypothetical protein
MSATHLSCMNKPICVTTQAEAKKSPSCERRTVSLDSQDARGRRGVLKIDGADMKDIETKQKFLEQRAQGKSLRTIEKEIGIRRRTLAQWESEYKEELENFTAIELDAQREEYRLTTQARIERFGGQLRRVMEELEKRDLSDIPTPKLVDLALKLDTRLRDAAVMPAITDEAGVEARKAARNLVESLGRGQGPMQSSKERHAAKGGNGRVDAADLVELEIRTLQRYEAGEIDSIVAEREVAIVNSIFKGIEVADLQKRLERLETVLGDGQGAR